MMALSLEPQELRRLAGVIQAELGFSFDESRWPDLRRHLQEMVAASPFANPQRFLAWLLAEASPAERVATLASHLTIGETYFYREPAIFALLQTELFPARLAAAVGRPPRKITIWSAGCSSGEEPYSVAIALSQLPATSAEFHIVASDVNSQALAKAKKGVYSSWSFRNPPPHLLANYFRPLGKNAYQLDESIRKRVRFLKINLMAAAYPEPLQEAGGVDLILCRNVLMYFDPESRARIVARFVNLLAPEGWLLVSPSETAFIAHPRLRLCQRQGIHLFQKKSAAAAHLVAAAPHADRPLFSPPAPVGVPALDPAPRPRPVAPVPAAPAPGPRGEELAALAGRHADGGDLAAAEERYRQAIAADKLNPLYYFHLAMILQALAREEEAALFFKKALFLEPNFLLAHFQLACLLPKRREAMKYLASAQALAARFPPEETVPHSEGITVGLLRETLSSLKAAKHG